MKKISFLFFLTISLLISHDAFAYIGPGLALSTILVTLGIVVSLLLGLFSVIYYPLKRLLKKIKSKKKIKKR